MKILLATMTVILANTAIAQIQTERVTFDVDGLQVVGTLYLPSKYNGDKRYPAVVVGGSLTSVKEMMSADYAENLAERGIMALAIDYRGYGESGGEIRQYEDPTMKAADLSGAVEYLGTRSDVRTDAIALVGICTSGGNVLYTAAQDNRVAAATTVAGWFVEPSVTPLLYGSEEAVEQLRQVGDTARQTYEATGENPIILAYSDTDQTASHVGPMEYYMDDSRGGGVAQWRNEFSLMSWNTWLDFDPVGQASNVTAPTLIIHSDNSALPEQARKVFDLLSGPKELHWAEGDHFDFYDDSTHVDDAAAVIADFFKRTFAS
jgi:fermentation-respiration switch protein FrsA (DUF1100 family)